MKQALKQIGNLSYIVLAMFGLVAVTLLWPVLIFIPILLLELAGAVVVKLFGLLGGFFI